MTKTIFSLLLITFIFAFSIKAQTPTPTPTPAVVPETILLPPQVQVPLPTKRWGFDDKTAPEAEARLKKIPDAQHAPDDIDIRIELIEYYERKDTPEAKKAAQPHRLWLVRNRPERPYYRELGWWMSEEDLKNPDYIALKEEWLKQVNLKKTNDKIRLGAARFLFQNEDALAEKLLKEGQQINPNLYDYYERLMEIYEYRFNTAVTDYEAAKANAREADIDAALRKLFVEGEKGLAVIAKTELLARSSDHFDLVVKLAAMALDLNELKKARAFAETALNLNLKKDESDEDSNDGGWFDTDKAIYYGNTLLGRVTLREGNTAKAKEHLSASLTFPEESEFKLQQIELDLAAELLAKGEKQAVLDYLARAEKLTIDEENIKIFRRWQRLIKRNSLPLWLGSVD
ncbi:MAG TPA: hypothetical protein VF599_05730 [Pyrinomonadaceae bacterium]|jgi:hypothetical protein